MEKAVATSVRLSAVDAEGSLVLRHPSHVGAIWATSASGVVLQGLVALSLILWRPTLSEDRGASTAGRRICCRSFGSGLCSRCAWANLSQKAVSRSLG